MSLASIKKRITVGTVLRMVRNDNKPVIFPTWTQEQVNKRMHAWQLMFTPRPVAVVQTNAIALRMSNDFLSWLYWPKAAHFRDTANGFQIDMSMTGDFTRVIEYVFEDAA